MNNPTGEKAIELLEQLQGVCDRQKSKIAALTEQLHEAEQHADTITECWCKPIDERNELQSLLEHAEAALRVKPTMEQLEQAKSENEQLEWLMNEMRNVTKQAVEENIALTEQHQWHLVEDSNPNEDGFYQIFDGHCIGWLYWQEGHRWSNEHEFEAFPTHWRYSTPPEQEKQA